jgi:hypothetical protein
LAQNAAAIAPQNPSHQAPVRPATIGQSMATAAVMKKVISMSGMGRRACRNQPCVVMVTSAANGPAAMPKRLRPTAKTTSAVPTAASAEGSAAVSWVT